MVVGTTFLEALWVVMFAGLWIGVVAVVIMSVIDNFKRTDHSGGAKAAWMLFIVLVPAPGSARLHDRAAVGPADDARTGTRAGATRRCCLVGGSARVRDAR